MVIETFLEGRNPVCARFAERGRMIPPGLVYLDSWLSADGTRCFQLMETADPQLFTVWTSHWADLVVFEIVPLGEKPMP
ncbi:MAG: DUF3303 family protein [Pseudomonadota bacterium]